ncbi:YeiH family protein [Tsukamurella sp. 1534]|uniref:YeiH family protein n=1 Tax=Tsukamurella sp. 1534 TaxID=1151061 RepID=UPI0005933DA5|nr:putative sulfate exporter family transporter [Tsukamurella sp. 1534]
MSTATVGAPVSHRSRVPRLRRALPGAALALAVAAVATLAGRALPVLGAPVAAVLLGAVLATALRPARRWPGTSSGFALTGGVALQVAVVLLGAQLSLGQAWAVGKSSVPVMVGTIAVCLVAAAVLGRVLGIEPTLRTLLGVGTAICGASAIAAVTPVLRPKPATVAYALSTVFVFNVAAVLTFPWLGHVLGMGQHAFGVFAGTAVNDTSSVVAAAVTFGPEAARTAVVVKLTRALMIVPVVLILAAVVARRRAGAEGAARPSALRLIPWFLVGFVALAGVNSLAPLPDGARSALAVTSTLLITWALAAIGLSTDLGALRRTGWTPLLFGGLLWVAVTGSSLAIQALTTGLG